MDAGVCQVRKTNFKAFGGNKNIEKHKTCVDVCVIYIYLVRLLS